jgi:hypothetical protein
MDMVWPASPMNLGMKELQLAIDIMVLELAAFFRFPRMMPIGFDRDQLHPDQRIHSEHIQRQAMVDETAKRLPPVRGRGRRFLVQDDLEGLFVHFRDPLVNADRKSAAARAGKKLMS